MDALASVVRIHPEQTKREGRAKEHRGKERGSGAEGNGRGERKGMRRWWGRTAGRRAPGNGGDLAVLASDKGGQRVEAVVPGREWSRGRGGGAKRPTAVSAEQSRGQEKGRVEMRLELSEVLLDSSHGCPFIGAR